MLRAGAEPYPVNPFHWFAVVETAVYYQTGSVNTLAETVDTNDQDDVIFKPPVTPAVEAAKRSWLGRVYLDWARFPLVTDRGRANLVASDDLAPQPQDTAVEFRDLQICLLSPRPRQRKGLLGTNRLGLRNAGRRHRRHGHEQPPAEITPGEPHLQFKSRRGLYQARRKSDGCPTFATAYVGRKRWATRISCHGAPPTSACAAFIKESRHGVRQRQQGLQEIRGKPQRSPFLDRAENPGIRNRPRNGNPTPPPCAPIFPAGTSFQGVAARMLCIRARL